MKNGIEEAGSDEHNCLMNDMIAMLERAKAPKLVPNCCIYKVPQTVREINEGVYTPKVVSIGPLHHGDKRLEAMEELKLGYLKSYLERTKMKLEDCIEKVKEKEEYIRSCYAETILQSSDDFVKMILIDVCFIIELFLRNFESSWVGSDPIFSNALRNLETKKDLILLENQLPFLVLEDLFTPTQINDRWYSSFLETSFNYFRQNFNFPHNYNFAFDYFCEHHIKIKRHDGECEEVQVQHLTDLLRIFHLPCCELQPEREYRPLENLYSASQLLEAGVKFKIARNKSLTELQFEEDVFTIPQLWVDDNTDVFLKNIAALEQCYYPFETYIGDYLILLQFLINDRTDFDILVDKGILVNFGSKNDKRFAIFGDILRGMVFSTTRVDYLKLSESLNDFCKKPLHKYKANLIRDYFNTPWKTASSIAAIVLLLLTLIQTISSTIPLF